MKKIGKKIEKCVLWSLVFALLFSTTAMAAITAEEFTGNINEVKVGDMLDAAAEYQSIAHIMKKCIGSTAGKPDNTAGPGLSPSATAQDGIDEIFNPGNSPTSFYASNVRVSFGAWMIHKFNNGRNYTDITGYSQCDADVDGSDYSYEQNGYNVIVSAFADMVFEYDTSGKNKYKNILCNGSEPGLVSASNETTWVALGDESYDYSLDCINYLDNNHYYYYNQSYSSSVNGTSYSNGETYVRALYENWRAIKLNENPYIPSWENLDDFRYGSGYFELLNDFKYGCNASTNRGSGGDLEEVRVKVVNDKGEVDVKTYTYSTKSNKQVSVTGVERGCKEIVNDINEYADEYANEVREKRKQSCNDATKSYWLALKAQAEVALNPNPSRTGELVVGSGEDEKKFEYKNYEDVLDADGNVIGAELKEYTQEDKDYANEVIQQVNEMEAEDKFWSESESGGIICEKPKEFEWVDVPVSRPGDGSFTPGTTDSCQSAGGAAGLGWIICPVMEWMSGAADDAYNKFLKPQLQVPPALLGQNAWTGNSSDGANATYDAWGIFQGFANAVFSIILLIVIFSQLTGVGIDNYGIKKILPKLILTAVLANLSYVICQLAVDLSNILGNSLQNLFDGMVSNVSVTVPEMGDSSTINVAAGAVSVTLLVALVAGGIAIWSNPAILLSLLVGALGVLIAILFVFILLAARQAAIVILVVIAPLAFVCYALPNTKKLFDKWLKLVWSLLLVYPICGLLIGGGNFASRLLLAAGLNNSFAAALTAMLVGIVPLFFVPTVLKNSLNALGGLGGKISGFGKGISGRTQGAIKGSRAYKDAQKRGNERADRRFANRRAGVRVDRDGNVQNRRFSIRRRVAGTGVGRLLGMDAAMGAAQSQYVKQEMDRRANINTFDNRGIVQSQVTKAQNAEDERIIAGQVGVARNTDMARAGIRQKAENERMESEIKMDVAVAPINPANVQQRLQNQLNEALADNQVRVVPVELDLAVQRRKAAADSQELRNFTDQFANYSRDQLAAEASNANNWINSAGGTQRMQALLSTMESRGMENDIADMLEKGGDAIGNNAAVMQTLTGSKNRVFKAYGKAGAGMSYHDFMSGGKEQYLDASGNVTTEAVDVNGNANRRAYVDADTGQITANATSASGKQNSTARTRSIVDYARDKGADFIDGLDDKALNQIMKYQTGQAGVPRVQIMDGDMIAAAQSRINAQDAVNILDNLATDTIAHGGSVNYSASQYTSLNQSSRDTLDRLAPQYGNVRDNLVNISDEMVRSPEQRARLNDAGARVLNNARARRVDGGDRGTIQEAIQSIQVPHGDNGNGGGNGNGNGGGTS